MKIFIQIRIIHECIHAEHLNWKKMNKINENNNSLWNDVLSKQLPSTPYQYIFLIGIFYSFEFSLMKKDPLHLANQRFQRF